MKRGFGGRQREDEPTVTCIHGLEAENIAEKRTVGFGIPGVNYDVSA